MTATCSRPGAAQVKIISLGLGRTGTSSLRDALEMLGFPCYHMRTIVQGGGKDFNTWMKIGDGEGKPEDFDALFRDFSAVTDYPAAMYPAELYAAYPDAKFILTTRDPEKWEKSMKNTILKLFGIIHQLPTKTEAQELSSKWCKLYLEDKYHQGRLYTQTQQELLIHNERVKKTIPPDKLLVYEVSEGWDRLVHFLDVPKPTTAFPHVNDTATFVKTWFPLASVTNAEYSDPDFGKTIGGVMENNQGSLTRKQEYQGGDMDEKGR